MYWYVWVLVYFRLSIMYTMSHNGIRTLFDVDKYLSCAIVPWRNDVFYISRRFNISTNIKPGGLNGGKIVTG